MSTASADQKGKNYISSVCLALTIYFLFCYFSHSFFTLFHTHPLFLQMSIPLSLPPSAYGPLFLSVILSPSPHTQSRTVQCVGGRRKIRAHSWETKNFTPTWTWPIPVSQSWNHSNHLGVSQEPTPGSQENRTFCSLWLFSAKRTQTEKGCAQKKSKERRREMEKWNRC